MAPGVVVRNDDESASLLSDDGSPVLLAGVFTPPPPPQLHGKTTTRTPRRAVMRLIRSPFAAVRRMTTCADTDAISPTSVEQPSKKTAAGAVVERREARRRTSLEQLIRMETAPLVPLPPPSRLGRRSKPADTTSEVSIRTTAKEKHAQQELFSPCKSLVVSVSDGERRAAAVPPAVKSDAADDRRTNNAKRLVVVFESLRACSRAPGIGVGMATKGLLSRKVAGGASGCGPGKAELFYCRPIPMGRRCRVQHLEESPYK